MKKIYLLGLILCLVLSVKAQDSSEIEESDSKKEKRNYGTKHFFKVDLGLNNYLEKGEFPDQNNALYSVKPWGSWYVALNFINRTHVAGPLSLEWGGGTSWYNFKFENADTRIEKTSTLTNFFTDPRDISAIKSKLTASYINISIVPILDFGKTDRIRRSWRWGDDYLELDWKRKRGFRLGAGGFGGYRLGSHSKSVYKDSGDKERDKETSNFFLENFRYGIRGQVGFGRVDLFVNYDMNELFSENRGPELNAISFGFILL